MPSDKLCHIPSPPESSAQWSHPNTLGTNHRVLDSANDWRLRTRPTGDPLLKNTLHKFTKVPEGPTSAIPILQTCPGKSTCTSPDLHKKLQCYAIRTCTHVPYAKEKSSCTELAEDINDSHCSSRPNLMNDLHNVVGQLLNPDLKMCPLVRKESEKLRFSSVTIQTDEDCSDAGVVEVKKDELDNPSKSQPKNTYNESCQNINIPKRKTQSEPETKLRVSGQFNVCSKEPGDTYEAVLNSSDISSTDMESESACIRRPLPPTPPPMIKIPTNSSYADSRSAISDALSMRMPCSKEEPGPVASPKLLTEPVPEKRRSVAENMIPVAGKLLRPMETRSKSEDAQQQTDDPPFCQSGPERKVTVVEIRTEVEPAGEGICYSEEYQFRITDSDAQTMTKRPKVMRKRGAFNQKDRTPSEASFLQKMFNLTILVLMVAIVFKIST